MSIDERWPFCVFQILDLSATRTERNTLGSDRTQYENTLAMSIIQRWPFSSSVLDARCSCLTNRKEHFTVRENSVREHARDVHR